MPSTTLKRAHLFVTGQHHPNGDTFTESDLDAIVESFHALSQAGRVPLKFGHNDDQPITDGQPALGWVQKVWREGSNLYGDFHDVPESVAAAVKSGLYKFVSIELLKNAKQGDKTFPWVLDAVALLGADPPAVANLEDLQRLAASRQAEAVRLEHAEPLRFRRSFEFAAGADPDLPEAAHGGGRAPPQYTPPEHTAELRRLSRELEELKPLRQRTEKLTSDLAQANAESARFKKELDERIKVEEVQRINMKRRQALELLEAAVREKLIIPAQRLQYTKMLKLDDDDAVRTLNIADIEQLVQLSIGEARKVMFGRKAANRDPNDPAATNDDGTLNSQRFAREHAAKVATWAKANGFGTDVFAAWPAYMRAHPTEGDAVVSFCFENVAP